MEFYRRPDDVPLDANTVLTVGSFDGVHKAHQEILATVVRRAREHGGRSMVVTFDPHPQHILRPEKPLGLLTTLDERRELIASFGVGAMCVVPFTYEFSRTPWQDFLKRVLVERIGLREIVEGFNHHFGKDREGGMEAIRSVGDSLGFTVTVIPAIVVDGQQVSSTKIRTALTAGDVGTAGRYLGRPYRTTGIVVRGDKRGRSLGYPTANLEPEAPEKLVPLDGIYVVEAELSGERSFGLASIGVRPTFHTAGPRVMEVFLLDFDRDIYGLRMQVSFLHRLRGELKFGTREELIARMDRDKDEAQEFLKTYTQYDRRTA